MSLTTALWLLLAGVSAQAAPPEVSVRVTGVGARMATASGQSLYFYDRDVAGKSVCNGTCAKAWPPLTAPADAVAQDEWSVIVRDDGVRQWAFRGHPLYTFARDIAPGLTLGDGLQGVWRLAVDVIPRPSTITFQGTMAGWVAADAHGLTLYVHEGEGKSGKAQCSGACLKDWKPALAPAIAHAIGEWTAVLREDGLTQWSYRDQPLYLRVGDVEPGDMTGEGIDKAWHVLLLEPAPALPHWVKMQASDYGTILADQSGMTIYSIASLDRVSKTLCMEACIQKNWRPVIAAPDTKPSGNWSLSKRPDGSLQWMYRGRLVFTHTRDQRVGDIEGDRFADGIGDFGWNVIPAATLIGRAF